MSKRRVLDHYVTPAWTARRLLEDYDPPQRRALYDQDLRILDPCAARGELLTVVKDIYSEPVLCGACEINPAYEADLKAITGGAVIIGDFLKNVGVLKACEFDVVITNPPYSLAEAFIRASLEVAPTVVMLLRLNFLASQRRRDWLAEAKPGVFVLPNRPSFTSGGTDMTEYAWFVFGDPSVRGRLEFLALTSQDEIKEANERAKIIHSVAA